VPSLGSEVGARLLLGAIVVAFSQIAVLGLEVRPAERGRKVL
jgi:hypothetical protein